MKRFLKNYEQDKNQINLSVILIISLLLLTGVIHVSQTRAAALTNKSDTISTSAPDADANHTIEFTSPSGWGTASTTIEITFPSGFDLTSLVDDDFEVRDYYDEAPNCTGAYDPHTVTPSGQFAVATSGQVITLSQETGAGNFFAGRCIGILIGSHAVNGANQIGNPSKVLGAGISDVHEISIAGTFGDTGDMLIAIIEPVTVSVTIDERLTFTIDPVDLGDCNTKFGSEPGATTTTTTVPFGTVTNSNTFNHACHDLTVSTNASSGYSMTAETDTSLKSGGSVLIPNGDCDASPGCTETATDTWATTSENGFGYTTTGTDSIITTDTDYRVFACTGATTTDCLPRGGESAAAIASNSSSVNNSTTSIEYRLNLVGTQPAGTYTNVVTYITTPTF